MAYTKHNFKSGDILTAQALNEMENGIAAGGTGTVTSVAVKMNGATKGTITSSGTIDLGTVVTLQQVYPVGSVYFSVSNTNPATTFGFGTWELIGSKLAISENVFGNGKGFALTEGSNVYPLGFNYSRTQYAVGPAWASVGSANGTTTDTGNIFNNQKVVGSPTKAQLGANPQNSGLIVDTETIYSWKRTA